MRCAWSAAIVTLLLAWTRAVSAQGGEEIPLRDPTEAEIAEARHSFEVASAAFDAGDYETAASEFARAYALTHAADLQFNLYLAHEREGNLTQAADALAVYLRDGTVAPEERVLLEGRLERLRARIATHASATSDDTSSDALLDAPLIIVQEQGHRTVIEESTPLVPIVTSILAGVLLGSFAVFATLSEVEDQRLASSCGRDSGRVCSSSDTASLLAYDIAADASWITAAVLGATSVVLFLVMPPDRHERPVVALLPWGIASGSGSAGASGGLSLRGSF